MQDPWHQMTADHTLPPPDEWAGREIAPDDYADDQEMISPHYLMFG